MKKTLGILSVTISGLLALSSAGCHHKAESAQPQTLQEGLAQLQASLATASPQAQSNFFSGVSYGIRYGSYAKASVALQQIASDPSLNDQQKKLVSAVSDLVQKEAAAQAPAH